MEDVVGELASLKSPTTESTTVIVEATTDDLPTSDNDTSCIQVSILWTCIDYWRAQADVRRSNECDEPQCGVATDHGGSEGARGLPAHCTSNSRQPIFAKKGRLGSLVAYEGEVVVRSGSHCVLVWMDGWMDGRRLVKCLLVGEVVGMGEVALVIVV